MSVTLPDAIETQAYEVVQSGSRVKDVLVEFRPGVNHMIINLGYPADTPIVDYVTTLPSSPTDGTTRLLAVGGQKSISAVAREESGTVAGTVDFKTDRTGRSMVTITEYERDADDNTKWKKTTTVPLTFNVIVSRVDERPVMVD